MACTQFPSHPFTALVGFPDELKRTQIAQVEEYSLDCVLCSQESFQAFLSILHKIELFSTSGGFVLPGREIAWCVFAAGCHAQDSLSLIKRRFSPSEH